MKNMNDIIKHLKYDPCFKKLNTSKLIEEFICVLPPKLKNGIKFAYIKNDIMYFVLKHQTFNMEFKYNKDLIKSLLKYSKLNYIKDINFFVTNKPPRKKIEEFFTIAKNPTYKERSYGIFSNKAKNPIVKNFFEEIRKIIKKS